ncbi:MAG: hypothetical protein KKA73_26210 [Chloroflexi bacterium]|nr:hypothetical protein [Chloroflexota bacterium]
MDFSVTIGAYHDTLLQLGHDFLYTLAIDQANWHILFVGINVVEFKCGYALGVTTYAAFATAAFYKRDFDFLLSLLTDLIKALFARRIRSTTAV